MNKKLSILIVDDHPGMCTTLKDILEAEEYKVTAVLSGKGAINLCKKQKFDVILMDIRMPDINGVETYRKIKNYALGTRVIMMSGYSVDELKTEALREGAVAFLQKPLDIEKTLQIIQQAECPPVLIVMENLEERESLAVRLSELNYRAYTTNTAEEALNLANQIPFNLIMIDAKLHTMSSLGLYLALKKITPTAVTILLAETDKNFSKQGEKEVGLNNYNYLEKPLNINKLLSFLDNVKRQQKV